MHYREQFRFSIAIHCNSLVEDFQEDLEFKFSLGFSQLIRRFLAFRKSSASNQSSAGSQPLFGGALVCETVA